MSRETKTLIAAALCFSASNACAANLKVGSYGVSSLYTMVMASGGGSCAPFTQGTTLSSEFDYPGPAKPGAIARTYLNTSNGAYVLVQSYPTTAPRGATTWSGDLTEAYLPGGATVAGTFSSTFTVIDDESYVDTTTYVFPVTGGTCMSIVQHVGIWSGK